MFSRRFMLGFSFALALVVHGTFLAVAPSMHLKAMRTPPKKATHFYKVNLRDEPIQEPEDAPQDAKKGRTSGPGSIEDLLKRETQMIQASESPAIKPIDAPQIAERLAAEIIDRPHFLEPDPDAFRAVDARIVEITQQTARSDLDIPRRIVSPSPERIIAENEFPVLRGPSDDADKPITVTSLPAKSLLGQTVQPPGGEGGAGKPPIEPNVVAPPPVAAIPPLPLEHHRIAPVIDEIKKENVYAFMDDLIDIKVETFCPPDEKTGYFRLRVLPKEGGKITPLPKDVTFVIDASNSIVQHKLAITAKATRSMVEALRPEDRFNIVVFRDNATSFQPDRVPATPGNKSAAISFITNLESRGQTDVYNAVRPVIQSPPRQGIPNIILFMSDGRPTTGVRDARTIINSLTAENTLDNTVYAFGGGNTVNTYLLDLLAYRNKGEARVTPSIDSIPKELPNFFSTLNDPLLTNLNSDYGSIDKSEVYPKEIPDFYRDRAVTVYGRFDPKKDKELFMRLTGNAEAQKKEVLFKANLDQAPAGNEQIARDWAFQKVYYLIGEICRTGEKPELLDELKALSRKYNIKTSYDE